MARSPSNITINTQLSTTAAALNTLPASGESLIVRKISFYNSSTTLSRQVTVYIVESSGTAGTANTLVKRTIPPLKTWNCVEAQGEVLEVNMSIQADQDAGTDVNVNCAGTRAV